MKKIRVGVLMGGASSEREVSLVTGAAVVKNLDRTKYVVTPIEMTREGHFVIRTAGKLTRLDFINKDRTRFDCVFIALHGSPGEDGTVQGMFESLGIRYTGSNTLASALAMNKVFAGQIYFANNLPHPLFIHVKKDGWKKYPKKVLKDVRKIISYPAVVKPVDQGSAVGVSIVHTENELKSVLNRTFKKFSWLMVQKFVRGKEATCGVIEKDGELVALPPTRIQPNLGKFYDYKSKYKKGGSTHICPADFPPAVNARIQQLALLAHKALRCSGMSRTDIFVADEKNAPSKSRTPIRDLETSAYDNFDGLYLIETNTIPGMTPTSLLPEAAAQAGITFSRMLDYIVDSSLKK